MKTYAVTRNTDISVTKQSNLFGKNFKYDVYAHNLCFEINEGNTRGCRTKGEKSLIELQIFNGASPMKSIREQMSVTKKESGSAMALHYFMREKVK